MAAKNKKQCPIRLPYKTYEEIKEKLDDDGLSFQTLGDILFIAYLRDDRGIRKIVNKRKKKQGDKKGIQSMDDMEKEDLLRYIEENISPLGALEKRIKEEIEDEQILHPGN